MLITLIVIVGLAVLIIGHEFGHFLMAKWSGMKVEEFGIGFPPRLWRKKKGETTYSVNLLPFGGFVRIAGEGDGVMDDGTVPANISTEEKKRYFGNQPIWKRSLVILAGVVMNLILGWLMLSIIFMIGTGPSLLIGAVDPGSPAQKAGIQPGDIVQGFQSTDQFISYVRAHQGQEITLKFNRNGQDISFTLTPRTNPGPDQGPIGVEFGGIPRLGFVDAFKQGFWMSAQMVQLTFMGLGELVRSIFLHGSVPADITGPVGIFGMAQEAGHIGLIYLLELLAFISINLGVINLIPFPALDGGRFVMLLIEKIKGSPIPRRAENWINAVGFGLLILLMVVVTIRDVIRL